jgi:glycosyltransferase involved in cell wall biosynthesis
MIKKVLLKPRFSGMSLHSLYKSILENPPDGYSIEYNEKKDKNFAYSIDNKSANPFIRQLIYNLKPIPYIIAQKLQKNNFNYDLVYASQHILYNYEKPWITDCEFVNAFAAFGNISLVKEDVRKRLEAKSCKFILPWSDWSKETILNSIDCTNLKEKIRVIRYTVKPKNFTKIKHDEVNFLFVGSSNLMNARNIQFKNLKETIIAFNIISTKYDKISLTIRAYVPEELKQIANKNSKIKIIDSYLKEKDLFDLYVNADIFVLPSHETSGISLLDAMSFEIPVIAMNIYDIPEVISHLKNGILISPPPQMKYYTKTKAPNDHSLNFIKGMVKYSEYIVSQLEEFFALLIEDSKLRKKIGIEARQTIEKGEFSLENQRQKILSVFEEATK